MGAQSRRNVDNVKELGDELQKVFEKIKKQSLNKKEIIKSVIEKIKISKNWFQKK